MSTLSLNFEINFSVVKFDGKLNCKDIGTKDLEKMDNHRYFSHSILIFNDSVIISRYVNRFNNSNCRIIKDGYRNE